MKDILKEYFQWYIEADTAELPEAPLLDGAEAGIFESEPKDGWVKWRPKEKDEYFDLSPLEANANIQFHQSVKDYLNSYWFCTLLVEYKGYELLFDPIVPGNYQKAFLTKLLGYKEAHGGKIEHVPIGFEQNTSLLIVVENETGEVYLEDYEVGEFTKIATDLYQLLQDGE
jgi:hypothetical protein